LANYTDKKFALVGSGLIGAQWAVHFLRMGMKNIKLFDSFPASLEKAKERIDEGLQWFVEQGALTQAEKDKLVKLPKYTSDMKDAVGDADFVLEQVFENLELKQKVLAEIEAACPADTIISSSTSGIMVRNIAANAVHPERVIGAHPYLPVYLLPLVEIVTDEKVTKENLDTLVDMFKSVNKKPVILKKDSPGYLGTRLMIALFREASYIVHQGICTIEDVDTAFTFGPGLRYALVGPNMTYHLTGGDGGADLLHNAGELMSQHHRGLHISGAFFAVIDMNIRAADASGHIADAHLVRAAGAKGKLPHLKLLVAQKEIAFHMLPPYCVMMGPL